MAKAHYKLYGKVDKYDLDLIEFMGTMDELCEYTGVSSNTIRSYISHCGRNHKPCPYVCLGSVYEDETDEEKRERINKYHRDYYRKRRKDGKTRTNGR